MLVHVLAREGASQNEFTTGFYKLGWKMFLKTPLERVLLLLWYSLKAPDCTTAVVFSPHFVGLGRAGLLCEHSPSSAAWS